MVLALVAGPTDDGRESVAPPPNIEPNIDPNIHPNIEWIAPAACPDAATAAEELGHAVAAAPARVEEIAGTVAADPQGFVLRYAFVLDGRAHAGQLHAPACSSLVDGLAAILAVAVAEGPTPAPTPIDLPDPVAPRAPVAITTTPPATIAAPRTSDDPPAPPPRRRPLRARLELGGGAARGVVPAWSGLLTGAVGLGQRHWSVAVEANVELPRTVRAPGPFDARARLWVATAGPRVCGILGRGRVDGELCAGAQLGAVRGRGMGRDVIARDGASLVAIAVPSAAMRVRVSPRVGVRLGADLLVPLARAHFGLDGIGDVCCSAVGVRLRTGVEVQLP